MTQDDSESIIMTQDDSGCFQDDSGWLWMDLGNMVIGYMVPGHMVLGYMVFGYRVFGYTVLGYKVFGYMVLGYIVLPENGDEGWIALINAK